MVVGDKSKIKVLIEILGDLALDRRVSIERFRSREFTGVDLLNNLFADLPEMRHTERIVAQLG